MISPFVIPDFIDPYALSVENRWGDRKLTGVNLLKNWGKVTLKQYSLSVLETSSQDLYPT